MQLIRIMSFGISVLFKIGFDHRALITVSELLSSGYYTKYEAALRHLQRLC